MIMRLCEFYTEPCWWTKSWDVLFLIFTMIYNSSTVIRIVGLGWTRFSQ